MSEEKVTLTGYPIIYNRTTDIGGLFKEVILPGAINEESLSNVILINNKGVEIARVKDGSLKVEIDDKGLKVTTNLKDVDLSRLGFSMKVQEEEWEDCNSPCPKRIIKKMEVLKVLAHQKRSKNENLDKKSR